MKVSEYIADFLASQGVTHVFGVAGGGNSFMADAIAYHPKLKFVAMHHEQAAGFAAEGYARATGRLGVCLVTSGPGGTNALTALAACWLDHVPVLFLSGQSFTTQMIGNTGCRQIGVQEIDIVHGAMYWSKFTHFARYASELQVMLGMAPSKAFSDRHGPVWIDVPADVQNADLAA